MIDDLQKLVVLLADYCPQSTNGGEPEPIDAGHPIHDAVVAIQRCFPDGKLPGEARTEWYGLARTSREGDPEAFEYAERLAIWARGLLAVPDLETLEPVDRRILEAIPRDAYETSEEIASRLRDKPTASTIRQRLRPSFPLRKGGFVEKHPTGQGYRRKV